jgi:hypothetical protein
MLAGTLKEPKSNRQLSPILGQLKHEQHRNTFDFDSDEGKKVTQLEA